jgi:hypothetical protein
MRSYFCALGVMQIGAKTFRGTFSAHSGMALALCISLIIGNAAKSVIYGVDFLGHVFIYH